MLSRYLTIGFVCSPLVPMLVTLWLVAATATETVARMDALLLKLEGGVDGLGRKVDSAATVINRDLVELNKNLRQELGLP